MIMNNGIEVDKGSELYSHIQGLCKDIEVRFGQAITIPFPMQEVDTGAGTDKCDAFRIRLDYRKGGKSFYDGHLYPSSYYLNITPIEHTENGFRCLMFGGGNCTILECNRNTEKQRVLAVKAVKNELVDIVYKAFIHYNIKI